MLRFGVRTHQVMVNIVTAYEDMDKLSPLVDGLLNDISEITSMVNNVNTRKADSAFGEYEILLYGQPTVKENIGNFTIDISANATATSAATIAGAVTGTEMQVDVKEVDLPTAGVQFLITIAATAYYYDYYLTV